MSNFKTIKKLGLSITTWGGDPRTSAVLAQELETLLQSAQVVYGNSRYGWAFEKDDAYTHTALILAITPLKKKTKAEAAFELLSKITNDGFHLPNNADIVQQAKRILEMKDEV